MGNFTSEILENSGAEQWNHMDSEDNPTDVASRGCPPSEVINNKLWWHGRQSLKIHKARWPAHKIPDDTNLEAKTLKALTLFEE